MLYGRSNVIIMSKQHISNGYATTMQKAEIKENIRRVFVAYPLLLFAYLTRFTGPIRIYIFGRYIVFKLVRFFFVQWTHILREFHYSKYLNKGS